MAPDRPAALPPALGAVLPALRCPVCREPLAEAPAALRCPAGRSFDLARHGYAALAVGRSPGTADTPAMVAARETFLAARHFAPIAQALASAAARLAPPAVAPPAPGAALPPAAAGSGVPPAATPAAAAAVGEAAAAPSAAPPLLLDVGGGTGYYGAAVLDGQPGAYGLCLDLAAPALRRAARAHPRLAAAGADAWQPLPLADGCAAAALVVFAPRNAAELARVLAPQGILLLVSPDPDHLAELREPLGLLAVDPAKRDRESEAFADFEPVETHEIRFPMSLDREAVAAVVGMGPSAAHAPPDLAGRLAALPERTTVTAAVRLTALRPPRRDA